jgi:hypothetical protein
LQRSRVAAREREYLRIGRHVAAASGRALHREYVDPVTDVERPAYRATARDREAHRAWGFARGRCPNRAARHERAGRDGFDRNVSAHGVEITRREQRRERCRVGVHVRGAQH